MHCILAEVIRRLSKNRGYTIDQANRDEFNFCNKPIIIWLKTKNYKSHFFSFYYWQHSAEIISAIGYTVNAVFCIRETSFPTSLFFVLAGKSTEELAMATLINDSKHYSG
jgi:hypothetical protein